MKLNTLINKIKENDFIKNILTLFTGSVIAQAVGLVALPLLSRLYSPADFGTLGLYMSFVAIISIISGGGYEQAVMLPKKKTEAFHVFLLSVSIALIISLILLIIVLFFAAEIADLLNDKMLKKWLYFAPFSVFLLVFLKALNYWFNRAKEFKVIAISKIYKSGTNSAGSVFAGFLKMARIGLIGSWILSQFITAGYFILNIRKQDLRLIKINKLKFIALAKRYKKFPLYDSWSELLGVLSTELPVFFISSFFGGVVTGHYTFAYKILLVPALLITFSVGQAFYQRATEVQHDLEKMQLLTFSTIKRLFMIAVVPVALISVFGESIFSFVFGAKWELSGLYARYMSIWLLFVFVSSPFTPLFLIYNKQQIKFTFYIISVFVQILVFMVSALLLKLPPEDVIGIFWIVSATFRLIFLILTLNVIKIHFTKILSLILKYFLPIITLFIILKFLFL